jgi:hypothetical protein
VRCVVFGGCFWDKVVWVDCTTCCRNLTQQSASVCSHLAPQVPTLLGAGQLVLEVHACGSRLNQRPHQLVRIQVAAKACHTRYAGDPSSEFKARGQRLQLSWTEFDHASL